MASSKVTFTLDPATIQRLQNAAQQLSLPKSEIVREAITAFYDRLGRLSDRERAAMLRTFDKVVPQIATRPASDVDRELRDIRKARRGGGRRSTDARKQEIA